MNVEKLLANVEDFYSSLKSYEDWGTIENNKLGLHQKYSFHTKYLKPEMLIYRQTKSNSKLNFSPAVDILIKRKKIKVLFDGREFELPNIENGSANNSKRANQHSQETALSIASPYTSGINNFILPLLLRNTNKMAWTKSDDFKYVGKNEIQERTYHLIRKIKTPTAIWINLKSNSVKRIELGATFQDKATIGFASAIANVAKIFHKTENLEVEDVDAALLEATCVIDKAIYNRLNYNDMDFDF